MERILPCHTTSWRSTPPDHEIAELKSAQPTPGREKITPAAGLTTADRYLDEAPGLSRVIALVRFDLNARKYNVRYVNIDVGQSYLIATDDPMIFDVDSNAKSRRDHLNDMTDTLARYQSAIAAVGTLMVLPAFFIAEHERVTHTTFATGLYPRRSSTEVRKAIKLLGCAAVPFSKEVRCLESTPLRRTEDSVAVMPPELEFESAGFWKPLPPGSVARRWSCGAVRCAPDRGQKSGTTPTRIRASHGFRPLP